MIKKITLIIPQNTNFYRAVFWVTVSPDQHLNNFAQMYLGLKEQSVKGICFVVFFKLISIDTKLLGSN